MRFQSAALASLLFACANPVNNPTSVNAGVAGATSEGQAPPAVLQPQQPDPITSDPASAVTLRVTPASVAAGGTITLTLANGSTQGVGYNLCTSSIETSAGQSVPNDAMCPMLVRTLAPGQSTTFDYDLPASMAAGTYQILTKIEWIGSGQSAQIRSNSFQVTG